MQFLKNRAVQMDGVETVLVEWMSLGFLSEQLVLLLRGLAARHAWDLSEPAPRHSLLLSPISCSPCLPFWVDSLTLAENPWNKGM